ncbi:MAG: ORF6N domain-containing protein, partial [Acidobacteria bacterium]|nr:ORF6N domain-containing protein [Acidobacteriota bacterium]
DVDLAKLYGVTTGRLNEQLQRNRDRFPDDFAFPLAAQEVTGLISQNAISKPAGRGGRRSKPWAFTEQGVAMLSSVLRSPEAVRVNVEIMRIAFARENLQFRTNVGLTETKGKRAEATVTLRGPNGTSLGMATVSLEPFTHRQIPLGEFASVAELDSGWVELEVTGGGGTISGYTSVVDNRTGDSVFAPALPLTTIRRPLVIPAAANTPGAHSTRWRSDLWIVNGTGVGETTRLTFFRSDGTVFERVVAVDAESSTLLPNVIGGLFGTEGTGWIRIDDSVLTVTSRTWNDDPNGSFGQFIDAVTPDEAVTEGETAVVPDAFMNAAFRTNVGITEVSGDGPALVQIDVMNRSGLAACSTVLDLGPLRHRQVSLSQLGCGKLDGGRIEVRHLDGAGRIVAYGSIVDQKTGDPSYVRAE